MGRARTRRAETAQAPHAYRLDRTQTFSPSRTSRPHVLPVNLAGPTASYPRGGNPQTCRWARPRDDTGASARRAAGWQPTKRRRRSQGYPTTPLSAATTVQVAAALAVFLAAFFAVPSLFLATFLAGFSAPSACALLPPGLCGSPVASTTNSTSAIGALSPRR